MALSTLQLQVFLGTTRPETAPAELMQALRSVEVAVGEDGPGGFQLTFHAEKAGDGTDFQLLGSDLLQPFNRVILGVALPQTSQILIDGFITRQELRPLDQLPGSILSVTGEDLSVKMDMVQISTEYPQMRDSDIVRTILGRYSSLGITAKVEAPESEITPSDYVPQQNATDRAYLLRLAARYGFVFSVSPGSSRGSSTAYWGPVVTTGTPQKTLSVDLDSESNVEAVSFAYGALDPSVGYGEILDLTQAPAKPTSVSIGSPSDGTGLSARPALTSEASLAADPLSFSDRLSTLATRGTLLRHPGLTVAQGQARAQGLVNRSTERIVLADGELDTLTYGAVLMAPGIVDLRGAGSSYDGTYRVRRVLHRLDLVPGQWTYKQSFTLARDGVGTTIQSVPT